MNYEVSVFTSNYKKTSGFILLVIVTFHELRSIYIYFTCCYYFNELINLVFIFLAIIIFNELISFSI